MTVTSAATAVAEVRVLGVRHHGPGSARSTLDALDAFGPDVVCIEGPPEAEAIAPLAADPTMAPPVALLAYDLDHPSTATFWPLASFSPEWQALRWAQRHGSAVRFIDLPAAQVLAAAADRRSETLEQPDPLAGLAAAAGYDDVERWWDDLVEHSDREVFAAVGEAMAAAREAAPPLSPGAVDDRREAHMRERVRAAIADGAARVAVVCGAWHGPALQDLSLVPAEADRALLSGRPSVKVAMTWVPWSSRRLAAGTGYGAGVRAPGWYHHLFTHAGPDVVARWFCEVAVVLRAGGHTVSPAQLIDATRLAEALATMRRRSLAGLSEVTDAAAAVLGEGGSAPMALVHEELVVGTSVGAVPADTPMVPLARDLAVWQRRLRLKPEDRTLELDLRRAGGLARSHLLHRLALLDVPWGIPLDGRGAAGTFRETWQLRWEPELSVRLVERSAFGTTVEVAAGAYVVHLANGEAGLADLTRLVEGCLLADLPAALGEVMRVLAGRAAVHAEVPQLMDALGPLARARRYGDVRGTDVAALDTVLRGLVVRITSGLGPACTNLDADEAAAMGHRLQATQAALALLAANEDAANEETANEGTAGHEPLWFRALAGLVQGPTVPGLVRGRASRLLLDAEQLDAAGAGRLLGRALTAGTPAREGAAFVEGFLAGSGTVLVHDRALLGLVDEWVAELPADAFTDALPLLRRTFATFEPSERRLIGELVRRGGADAQGDAGLAAGLDEERVRAALATMAAMLGVEHGDRR